MRFPVSRYSGIAIIELIRQFSNPLALKELHSMINSLMQLIFVVKKPFCSVISI